MNGQIPFFEEIAIAGGMVAATVFFHAIVISGLAAVFRATTSKVWGPMRFVRDSFMLSAESLILMAAHAAEVAAWAFLLIHLGAFETFETALYFAGGAYTTVGGDVFLPREWRILSGALGANGMLLFGLSAAFLLESAQRLRIGDQRKG